MAIGFARRVPAGPVTTPLVSQLVRAATSVGANYCEADEADTKRDFRYKIALCRKETRETRHWLRMIAYAVPKGLKGTDELLRESKELLLIFAAIGRKAAQPRAGRDA